MINLRTASKVAIASLAVVAGPATLAASASAATTSNTTVTDNVLTGTLSLSATSAVTATPDVTLNGTDQSNTYTLALTTGDSRGTGAGWNETISQTPFTSGANTLGANGTDTTGSAVTSVTDSDIAGSTNTAVVNNVPVPVSVSGTAAKFYNAATNSGEGNFLVNPVVKVDVPASSYAGTYTAVATVNLVSGP